MNGRAHFSVNTFVLLTTFGIVGATNPEVLLPAMTGATTGLVITPDYDFKNIYIKSVLAKIPILGVLWNFYWLPYALMFKHRKLSHNIVFGTLTRFVYLLLIPLLFLVYRGISFDMKSLAIFLCLWYIQDISHYILDSKLFGGKDD